MLTMIFLLDDVSDIDRFYTLLNILYLTKEIIQVYSEVIENPFKNFFS